MKRLVAVLLLLGAAGTGRVHGDSIDDAEAKKRGVPVAVIFLERQLEQEKRKTAELEKQVTEVEGKIDAFKAGKAEGDAGKAAGPMEDPAMPKLAEGERESSPVYDDLVKRYMSGDWTNLADDLVKKKGEIAKLPAGNASDIAYIKAAVAECKPGWWVRTKSGKAQAIDVAAFNRKLVVSWAPMKGGQSASTTSVKNQRVVVESGWPSEEMDSLAQGNAGTLIDVPPGNYTVGDMADSTAWLAVAMHIPSVELGAVKLAQLGRDDTSNLSKAEFMLGAAAAVYYGTPAARRFSVLRSVESFSIASRATSDLLSGRELMGAFLAAEFFMHPEKYPSLKLTFKDLPEELPRNVGPEEYLIQNGIDSALVANKPSFAEDCALRAAVWGFVMTQGDWTSGEIKLPGGQIVDVSTVRDRDLRKARWGWIRKTAEAKANEKPAN